MTSRDKRNLAIIIWVVAAVLNMAIILNNVPLDFWSAIAIVGVIGVSFGATMGITTGVKTIEEQPRADARTNSDWRKAKNSDSALVDRLIETMSDEELAVLRRRLTAGNSTTVGDDGELVTLEQALRGKGR
ncbi:MAG: hypothetical protein SF123_06860 [Chloroflexota bacterium]|nr:hypothetical protein [Chloroflexota bacterium]